MVLLHMVSAVSGLVKVRYLVDKAVIDNMVFRTHYRLTAALLFVCCIIVTANNLIGDPIQCISTARISPYIVNNYCWITQTFTMPDHLNDRIGVDVPHPGLANDQSGPKQYHSYYQWVPFVLFFQGLLFYLPHMIWKCWEEGKMRMITDGLRGTVVVSKEQKVQRQNMIVIYLMNTLTYHNYYAFGYYFCEFLNFLNVICNILFLDLFFDGFFLTYGLDVLKFSNMEQEKRLDPMIAVFPRMTKCNLFKYGSSGTLQKLDTICVLALNIINEKIFILLWFWFVVLAIVSTLTIIYSFTIIVLPSVREFILRKRIRYSSRSRLSMLMQRAQIGDFLILHFLSKNLNYFIFKEILDELIERLNCDNRSTPSAPSTIEMGPMGTIYSTNDETFEKV